MAVLWLALGHGAFIGSARAASVHGAGATFPLPLYSAWAEQYRRGTGIEVDYAPIGSVAGVEAITHRRVDFGASDSPLSPDELARLKLVQFPAVIGGVVPVVNISGIAAGDLKLTGAVLAAIYLGRLHRWNDPAIAELNPGLELPDANITVVHRADGSGTTRLWSLFLCASSDAWRGAVGSASSLAWPVGVAEQGNDGVASAVQRTRFAIGYVEFAYAQQRQLSVASLRNREGSFVMPDTASFEAAALASGWREDSGTTRDMVDAPGSRSWPITGASFVLLATPVRSESAAQVLSFFDWALSRGRQMAIDRGYVPGPAATVRSIESAAARVPSPAAPH